SFEGASGDRETSEIPKRSEVAFELRACAGGTHQSSHGTDTRGFQADGRDRWTHELFGPESPAGSQHTRVSFVLSRAGRPEACDRGLFADRAANTRRLVARHRAG